MIQIIVFPSKIIKLFASCIFHYQNNKLLFQSIDNDNVMQLFTFLALTDLLLVDTVLVGWFAVVVDFAALFPMFETVSD